jgi:hypothetical protein
MGLALTKIHKNDWDGVRRNFDKIKTHLLGPLAAVSHAGLTLSDLTNGRVIYAGAGGSLSDDSTFLFNSSTKILSVTGLIISGTTAIGLDMSGGTFATAVQNWPAMSVIQVAGIQTIKFDGSNFNVFLGTNAFAGDEGTCNIGIGYEAGLNNSITGGGINGTQNTYVGFKAGRGDAGGSTASKNIGIGSSVLLKTIDGSRNTAIGYQAMQDITTGDDNIALGEIALTNATSGSRNFALGTHALQAANGNDNIGIGYFALSTSTGSTNVAIGVRAIGNIAGSSENVGIGKFVGRYGAGDENVLIGSNAGYGVDGNTYNYNTVVGSYGGYSLTTGSTNAFFGYRAGYNQTTNDNLLIIDNQDRGSDANEITTSLMYGIFAAAAADQSLRINAKLIINGGRIISRTSVTSSPYTVLASDEHISITTASTAITLNLPAIIDGAIYHIKDQDENSAGKNITVSPDGSDTVENAASLTINTNGASVTLVGNLTTSNWEIQ